MSYNLSILTNNLPIITYKIPNLKSISINLIVKVGSRYENLDELGISHFLEHMAFKGTNKRSAKKLAEEFDSIGGHFNAYTSKEFTVYHTKVLKENLPKALDLISDIIKNSTFNEPDIKSEYNVICQEIAQMKDNPEDLAFENLMEKAFYNQNLGRSILGTKESIAKFSTESFFDFTKKHYGSNNMVLSFAGDTDHNEIVKLSEDFFGEMKSANNNFTDYASYTPGDVILEKDLEQSIVYIGLKSDGCENVTSLYHTQLLSLIVGGGISSKLFQKIRETLGLAYSVGCFNNSFKDIGLFTFYAGVSHENVQITCEKIAEEMLNIFGNISEEELERSKSQIKTNIILAQEKSSFKSEEIGKSYAIYGRHIDTDEIIENVEKITINDLENIAKTLLCSDLTFSVIGSQTKNINLEKIKSSFKLK